MKKISVYLVVIFLIISFSNLGAAKIKLLTPNKVKVASIRAGDTLYHTIKIKNVGKKLLEIYKVKSTCHCTILNFTPQSLKADEELAIDVAIDTRGMNGRAGRNVVIISNDDETPRLPVFFEMNVIPEISIQPRYLDFQECVVNKTYEKKLIITNNTEQDIFVEKVESDLSSLEINFKKQTIKPKKSIKIIVEFKPKKPIGLYKVLYIHTQNTENPLYRIPMYIRVTDHE